VSTQPHKASSAGRINAAQSERGIPARLLLIVPAVLSLVCGVLAGLGRLGLPVPAFSYTLVAQHGPLMVGGVFGTLICLERAVAVGGRFSMVAPLASCVGAIALLAGQTQAGALFACLAALVLTIVCFRLWQGQRVAHLATLTLGSACWLYGNAVWFATGVPALATLPWLAFLILTIAGERLELSRLMPTPKTARQVFAIVAGLFALAAVAAPTQAPLVGVFYGLCLLALALWLQRYDIARRTLLRPGLTRYIALCLLSGYVWLAVAGALGIAGGFALASPLRDAALHALALGFVFSMVFGHAPIILPAVGKIRVTWHPLAYAPLALLHAGVFARTLAALLDSAPLRQCAGLANAGALLLFVACVLAGVFWKGRTS
jgi:hypothetical protein